MKMTQQLAMPLCIASLLACSTHLSAQQMPLPAAGVPPVMLIETMANFRETYIAQVLAPFRAAVGTGQGLTSDDVKRAGQIGAAAARAQALTPFFSSDLDGDGQVTMQEYQTKQRRYWQSPVNNNVDDQVSKQFAEMDSNGDGVVTFEEAMAAAVRRVDERSGRMDEGDRLGQLLALDPNHDGILTADELEQRARAAFAFYDRDGDGMLSDDERKGLSADILAGRQSAAVRQQFSRCSVPRAEGREAVMLIDVAKAQALSSASLVGQDKVTETAEIAIEPGDTPLYVIAFGRLPIIWHVTGAVNRVTRFVAASNMSAVGVTGLPKAVVTLSPNMGCLGNRASDSAAVSSQVASALEPLIGRPVGGIVYQGFFKTQLPSGAATAAEMANARIMSPVAIPPGDRPPFPPPSIEAEANTAAALLRSHPGGLVEIDPAQVLSPSPVVAYEVLPMEAGLLKMLADGTLTQIGRQAYVINRPIPRTPAGLTGLNAVHYSLAPGVAPPPGYPVGPLNSPNGYRDLRPKPF